jgi:hypothetical protein
MGFTIEHVEKVSFDPCVGYPKEVDYSTLPAGVDKIVVVNGYFDSSFTGPMKLDKFTGYVTIESCQERATGDSEDRAYRSKVVFDNYTKGWEAFDNFARICHAFGNTKK